MKIYIFDGFVPKRPSEYDLIRGETIISCHFTFFSA